MSFKKEYKSKGSFTKISIGLASSEEIARVSKGEVTKPETINYRTFKPERDGLFCERIFGPVKDFECSCGKYKRIRFGGITCDRCGVEVTEKKVRRERVGHIGLVIPVAHIWYFRSLPNKMGHLLGLSTKSLDAVVYYERYIVLQAGKAANIEIREGVTVSDNDLLSADEYYSLVDNPELEGNASLDNSNPDKFIAKIGAEAIYDMLQGLDLDTLSYELRAIAKAETGSQQRKADALKRLQVVEAFRESKDRNKPEYMIIQTLPVIPPDLRPLVPLDGGRFAASDLNDLYRRVIIRNNRLKRMIEIKAPEVILRNEKRMLQEAVDSLFDNSRKSNSVKSDSNRPLKSLSDSLKGKTGRFRQNLLGKRVDYSARSVIVVGPELKMGECGIPKLMAAELYKPFIIRKLIERGLVKTVKSAKKLVDRKEAVVWDILEHVMKGHPVLLNRAPTLHRLGIQAFQPKMIEGKAIQLHPLACTAFNADFDGDQMAVHLPLSNEAILEAQLLMLNSHNILNPANGTPITVPSQDMVLGLYYITKLRKGAKGEGFTFYGPEEALVAYNEGRVALHAIVNVRTKDIDDNGEVVTKLIKETSVGRIIVNQMVPDKVGYVNRIISKGSLRSIISDVIKACGVSEAANFLDGIKNLGYQMAFKGGLSFNLDDIIIPKEKADLVAKGYEKVEEIINDYNFGQISQNERYNQIVDAWTHVNNQLTEKLMKTISEDDQGFNSVYMMLDSGARGSRDQIRQLSGMRGLMAKPQKAGAEGGQIIENPILANFKEGLSVLEYFISTHGARKGLADTALKTADAGYLTRRLVDVSHDVIINEEDCGTLRGLVCTELKKGEFVVASLYERILGRVSVHDVIHPNTGEVIVEQGQEITEDLAQKIQDSPIESVEIRSVLTCESKHGVCAKCYGRNLSTGQMVQKGEAVGVIAAQSIGEPGTQLTLRTFHAGGTASNAAAEASIVAHYDGHLEFDDLRTVDATETDKNTGKSVRVKIVVGRMTEVRLINDKTNIALSQYNIPYGSTLYVDEKGSVKKGDLICKWDPFNNVIVSDYNGKVKFDNMIENVTFKRENDLAANVSEIVIIDSKDKSKVPSINILDKKTGEVLRTYNLPVNGHIVVSDKSTIKAGDVMVKIPRSSSKAGDITGGLPRVTELFEARNPSDPAVVSEIDGEVRMGNVKRDKREIIITAKNGEEKKYLVPLTKQILIQDNDYVRAGTPLSDGSIMPSDILAIKGPTAVQEYIVNEVQDVYRLQGVKINDKHFEIIVRQMMRKVRIEEPGDTLFLEQDIVDKFAFMKANDDIWGKKVVTDAGDSEVLHAGQIVTARKLRDENSALKRKDKKTVTARDAEPAISSQVLQGITRAALGTYSFMSAASFQESTKILNEAAISGKVDKLEGMKENVMCGHLIPAGTGLREFDKLVVGSREDYEKMIAARSIITDFEDVIDI